MWNSPSIVHFQVQLEVVLKAVVPPANSTHAEVTLEDGAHHEVGAVLVVVSRPARRSLVVRACQWLLVKFLICGRYKVLLKVGSLARIRRFPHVKLTDCVVTRQTASLHLGEVARVYLYHVVSADW